MFLRTTPFILLFVVTLGLSGSPLSMALAVQSTDDADFGSDRFSVSEDGSYKCIGQLLTRIVDHRHKTGMQQFFVSMVGHRDDLTFVRVYWPEDKSILLVTLPVKCHSGAPDADDSDLDWYDRKARIDLETDVVPTDDDAGTSTYLVSQRWVNAVIQDCLKNGYPIVVQRPSPRKRAVQLAIATERAQLSSTASFRMIARAR